MPRYKLVVLSRPVEGREDEYNAWYQHPHLSDVVALKGINAAQRFRVAKSLSGDQHGNERPYLAVYDIETDDLEKTLSQFYDKAGTESMLISESLDTQTVYAVVFEEFGAPVKR